MLSLIPIPDVLKFQVEFPTFGTPVSGVRQDKLPRWHVPREDIFELFRRRLERWIVVKRQAFAAIWTFHLGVQIIRQYEFIALFAIGGSTTKVLKTRKTPTCNEFHLEPALAGCTQSISHDYQC